MNSPTFFDLDPTAWRDLELDLLKKELLVLGGPEGLLQQTLSRLEIDPARLRDRQEDLKVLLLAPSPQTDLEALVRTWSSLGEASASAALPPLQKVLRRIGELETWVQLVDILHRILKNSPLSPFWSELNTLVDATRKSQDHVLLQQILPDLRKQIQGVRGVSIGINLDSRLDPVGAVLLTVEQEPFVGRRGGLLGHLFSSSDEPLGPLHQPPYKTSQVANQTVAQDPEVHGWGVNPKSLPLFRDLGDILSRTASELDKKLQKFSRVNLEPWRGKSAYGLYLVRSALLLRTWKTLGIPLCFPEILPVGERTLGVKEMIPPPLLIQKLKSGSDWQGLMANNLNWDDSGRIHIITGPNSGGKTVYLQSLGWAQVLTQLGWPLPAVSARVSPAASLGTHFQKEEETGRDAGRFGEEVQRLKGLFEQLAPGGVVLMNESLSGTNALESYAIAWDLMKVLRVKGARGGFTTHLHELARDAEALNAEVEGSSRIASLVAQPETFQVLPGPPPGRSYARELASRYGLSFEQLV